jgi:type IV pilus assembly protein PilE
MQRRPPTRSPRSDAGFTLIEVMIAVAVIAIVSALAFPSFMESFRKGRRSEAIAAVNAVQLAQERWRANNTTYSSQLSNGPTDTPPGLGLPTRTASGYYDISLGSPSATGYTVLATAVSGTSQANDTRCKVMGAQMSGGNIKRGSGQSSIDWSASDADSGKCWAR